MWPVATVTREDTPQSVQSVQSVHQLGPPLWARRWDEKAGLQARYPSVPINNELYWLNGGQP
ncbi:MAG: hypothetical protein ACK58T_04660, partial [Phycisphaerae bacterium]